MTSPLLFWDINLDLKNKLNREMILRISIPKDLWQTRKNCFVNRANTFLNSVNMISNPREVIKCFNRGAVYIHLLN